MTQPTIEHTFEALSTEAIEALQSRLDRLADRAERLGLEAPTLTTEQTDGDAFRVTVRLTLPQQGRYLVAGHIAHCGEGLDGAHHNVVTAAPGYAGRLDPAHRNAAHGECAHCGVFRYRKASIIVHDTFDDKTFTVGTSCVADFAGDRLGRISAITQAAKITEALAGVVKDMETWRPTRSSSTIPTTEFVAATVALARMEGFASGRYTTVYGGTPTGLRVLEHYNELVEDHVTEDDRGVAAVALDWFAEHVDERSRAVSDLLANVKAVTCFENLLEAHAVTVAYAAAVFMYRHDMEVRVPAEPIEPHEEPTRRDTVPHTERPLKGVKRAPTWRLGETVQVDGTVERFFPTTSQYGAAHLVIVNVPELDRPVKAFLRNFGDGAFAPGDAVTLRGTVADLTPYRGRPQARLNRPYIVAR